MLLIRGMHAWLERSYYYALLIRHVSARYKYSGQDSEPLLQLLAVYNAFGSCQEVPAKRHLN